MTLPRSALIQIGPQVYESTIPSVMGARILGELVEAIAEPASIDRAMQAYTLQLATLPIAAGFIITSQLFSSSSQRFVGTSSISDVEKAALLAITSFRTASEGSFRKRGRIDFRYMAACYRPFHNRKVICGMRTDLVFVDRRGEYTSYIPPPHDHVPRLLLDLATFVKDNVAPTSSRHALALAFYCFLQFLAIHPFNDGNGRSARLIFVKVASLGGVPVFFSLLLMDVLHTFMLEATQFGVMEFCVTGSINSFVETISQAIRKAAGAQHHPFWRECDEAPGDLPKLSGAPLVQVEQFRSLYKGMSEVFL